jgi:hypothetical protein
MYWKMRSAGSGTYSTVRWAEMRLVMLFLNPGALINQTGQNNQEKEKQNERVYYGMHGSS